MSFIDSLNIEFQGANDLNSVMDKNNEPIKIPFEFPSFFFIAFMKGLSNR